MANTFFANVYSSWGQGITEVKGGMVLTFYEIKYLNAKCLLKYMQALYFRLHFLCLVCFCLQLKGTGIKFCHVFLCSLSHYFRLGRSKLQEDLSGIATKSVQILMRDKKNLLVGNWHILYEHGGKITWVILQSIKQESCHFSKDDYVFSSIITEIDTSLETHCCMYGGVRSAIK